MKSATILERAAPEAELEVQLPDGQGILRVPLARLPFVIGRADSADLKVASTRVSREHAVISWEGSSFWVRDLGSTNGTFAGGRRVERVELQNGDLLTLADVEVRLHVLDVQLDDDRLVSRIRGWQELLMTRGLRVVYSPVWDLREGRLAEVIAEPRTEGLAETSRWPDRPLRRARGSEALAWQQALWALEGARSLPAGLPLVVRVPQRGGDLWLRVLASIAERPVLLLDASFDAARLAACGLGLAREVGAGEPPAGADQWWLAPELTRSVATDEGRWQPISELVEAATRCGAAVVATGIADEESAQICGELGCAYASGPFFGSVLPTVHEGETP